VIVLAYFDWFGTAEELKEFDEQVKAACAEIDGVEEKGRYGPHNRKYHWVRIFETEKYPLGIDSKMPPRDYKKLTHWVTEILSGPVDLD